MIERNEVQAAAYDSAGEAGLSKDELVHLIVDWRGRLRTAMPASLLGKWQEDELEHYWQELQKAGR